MVHFSQHMLKKLYLCLLRLKINEKEAGNGRNKKSVCNAFDVILKVPVHDNLQMQTGSHQAHKLLIYAIR